jgi:hypothetical protein
VYRRKVRRRRRDVRASRSVRRGHRGGEIGIDSGLRVLLRDESEWITEGERRVVLRSIGE